MARTPHHFALVSALALALTPAAAHARFGKASDSSEKKNDDHNNGNGNNGNHHGHDHDRQDNDSGGYHAATPVGAPDRERPSATRCRSSADGCCWRHGDAWPAYFYEPAPVYAGYGYSGATEVQGSSGVKLRTELTGEVMPLSTLDGGLASAQLRIEGLRWGVAVEGQHISVAADDGTAAVDHLSFFNGFFTYALLGSERGRLRLEAGAQTAFAPDLIVMSPAVGLSFALGFGDQLGLEARARASLLPHVQVELVGGLSYALGPLGLRFGWRQLYLNDNGLVDGIAHSDRFSGPYLGAGLAF